MLYEIFKIVISYNIHHEKQVLLPSFFMLCCLKTSFSFIFTTFAVVDVHGESIHYKKGNKYHGQQTYRLL